MLLVLLFLRLVLEEALAEDDDVDSFGSDSDAAFDLVLFDLLSSLGRSD